MRTVHKFPLAGPRPTLRVPGGSKLVAFAFQRGVPTMWYEIAEPVGVVASHNYVVVPTGGDVPDEATHCGSAVSDDLVWHLYRMPR